MKTINYCNQIITIHSIGTWTWNVPYAFFFKMFISINAENFQFCSKRTPILIISITVYFFANQKQKKEIKIKINNEKNTLKQLSSCQLFWYKFKYAFDLSRSWNEENQFILLQRKNLLVQHFKLNHIAKLAKIRMAASSFTAELNKFAELTLQHDTDTN